MSSPPSVAKSEDYVSTVAVDRSEGFSLCSFARHKIAHVDNGRLTQTDGNKAELLTFCSSFFGRDHSLKHLQALSGGGGWPMSVWLTPDLKPIVGGTYFPPDDNLFGRPGFSSVLKKISSQVCVLCVSRFRWMLAFVVLFTTQYIPSFFTISEEFENF